MTLSPIRDDANHLKVPPLKTSLLRRHAFCFLVLFNSLSTLVTVGQTAFAQETAPAADAPKPDANEPPAPALPTSTDQPADPAPAAPVPAADAPKPAADAPKPAADAPAPSPAVEPPKVEEPKPAEPAGPTPEELEKQRVEQERQRFAISDINLVDADYHIQGEYAGPITLDGYLCPVGLQVVARGDGQFDALLYRGGLPGNGYDGSPRHKLSGTRSGEQVVLKSDTVVVFLQAGFAAVAKTPAGQRLGFLQPVKRVSTTMGAEAPTGALILFDGKNTDHLLDAKVTPDGLLEVGTETKQTFQNFTLHAEFRTPYMPYAKGQNRGNSGFYLQRRYEVQVLDSFGLELQFNDCASLYRFKAPDLNMSFPPLRWQTYDLTFTGAKFSPCGEKVCKARITVRHNGVVVQNNLELENKTGGGRPEGPDALPILLQNHKNPVHFRNIWLVDHDRYCTTPASYGSTPGVACGASPCRLERRWHHRVRDN